MNKYQEIAIKLAEDSIYEEIWDLAYAIVIKVTEYNKRVLLRNVPSKKLDISEECAELRKKMAQFGFVETPSSDKEFYRKIIQPLIMRRIEKAL